MSRSTWDEVASAEIGSMIVARDAGGALVSGQVVAVDGQRCCLKLRSGDGEPRDVFFAARAALTEEQEVAAGAALAEEITGEIGVLEALVPDAVDVLHEKVDKLATEHAAKKPKG